jgi:hypothetical protein
MVTILVMDAAQTIREAVSKVFALRSERVANPQLGSAIAEVKLFQARRFSKTYVDILSGGTYQGAAKFFLEELYGDKDYSHRDTQFSRIAGALQKLLPQQALATAVLLAKLHAMTEELDHVMGFAWLDLKNDSLATGLLPGGTKTEPDLHYIQAWRGVGRRAERRLQLTSVLDIGRNLSRLTQTPGLRLMLKMMRRPAEAAGLGDLQHFLEGGFDTFAKMTTIKNAAQGFLGLIEQRETTLLDNLFDTPPDEMAARLESGG